MKNRISHLLNFILPVLLSFSASANDFKVLTEHYPPYIFEDNNQLKGLAVDVVNEALKQAGIEKSIELYPWARTIQLAKNDEPLIAFPVMKDKQRNDYFSWIGPVAKAELWLFKLSKRKLIKVESLEDAKFFSVGVVRGGIAEDFLKKNGFANLVDITEIEQGMNMLRIGSVDLIVMDKYSMQYFQTKNNLGELEFEKAFMLEELSKEAYLASNKSFPEELVLRIREALVSMRSSGKYQQIESNFFESLENQK